MSRFSVLFKAFLCVLTINLIAANSAFAYIDPGTGATFVGSMAPLIVGVLSGAAAFFVKVFWHPIKRIFAKKTKGEAEAS